MAAFAARTANASSCWRHYSRDAHGASRRRPRAVATGAIPDGGLTGQHRAGSAQTQARAAGGLRRRATGRGRRRPRIAQGGRVAAVAARRAGGGGLGDDAGRRHRPACRQRQRPTGTEAHACGRRRPRHHGSYDGRQRRGWLGRLLLCARRGRRPHSATGIGGLARGSQRSTTQGRIHGGRVRRGASAGRRREGAPAALHAHGRIVWCVGCGGGGGDGDGHAPASDHCCRRL
eukprot:2579057-Pleurochrysis_carterae.AAC.1